MANLDYAIDTSHYDECLNVMLRHKNRHRIRTIAMLVLSITNGYFHIAFYANIVIAGIYIGVFSILYMLAVMVLSFFSTSDKPVLVILTVAMYALGLWYAYSPIFGVPLLIMYGLQLFECPKAVWVKKQSGYPYFSERFNDQQKIAFQDYDSTYEIDDNAGEMTDVGGEKDVLFAEKVTMPGVPDLPDAMPEPLEKSIPHLNEVPAAASVLPPPEKEETIIPEVAVLNAAALAPMEKVKSAMPDYEDVEMPVPLMETAEKETGKTVQSEEISVPMKKTFRHQEIAHAMEAASGEICFEGEKPHTVRTLRAEAVPPLTPVQDVPSVSDIPAPVWDVPDPVMDTSIITSDFPEINGDIPDLPDIPDIPQI